jgi:hypothetical protein
MNFDSTQYEYVTNFRSLFVNDDKRNGGKKLSLTFNVVGKLFQGEVTQEGLPEQRRFKSDITLFHGANPDKDKESFIKKVNSFRRCLGLSSVKTDGVLRILDTTRLDFMFLKEAKCVPVALVSFRINPTMTIETIKGQSHQFQWANSLFFKPTFLEAVNPKGPQQGELF